MMASQRPYRPPFDPAYTLGSGRPENPKDLQITQTRKIMNAVTLSDVLAAFPNITHTEHSAPGIPELSSTPVPISIYQTKTSTSRSRGIAIYVHGGGQVMGNRFFGPKEHLSHQPLTDDVVLASIGYRLAPEHRAPAAAYDCYAAIVYLSEHATELGIDPARMVLIAVSGGAAPAAAACLLASQMGRPRPGICAAVLSFPMLDDREHYTSWRQFESETLWSGRYNRQAWEAVLGPGERDKLNGLHVPARAACLAGLPDVYIEVGECEVFRDSAIAFAGRILAGGGSCELHVWPGMYHAAAAIEPNTAVSKKALAAQRSFVDRKLGLVRNGKEEQALL